jgi:hypothetical protein
MKDIVNQLPVAINGFMDSEALRTCRKCGDQMQRPK